LSPKLIKSRKSQPATKALVHATSTFAKASEQRNQLPPKLHNNQPKPPISVEAANQPIPPEGRAKPDLVVITRAKEFKRTPPNRTVRGYSRGLSLTHSQEIKSGNNISKFFKMPSDSKHSDYGKHLIQNFKIKTTELEMCAAIASQYGINAERIRVRSLRRGYAESQSAVIHLPYSLGKAVLHHGEVRIGWISAGSGKEQAPQDASNAWNPGILQVRQEPSG